MPSRSSFERLWKYSLTLIIITMVELGLGIADIIIKCPICKEASYIPAACFALPVWTPLLLIGTSALGLMTGPESQNRNKLLRWCLVLSFISIAVSLVVMGWCVTNIVQSVSTGLLAEIGMKSIALAALIIIVSLVEICLFIPFSLNSIDLVDRASKKGDSENGSGLSNGLSDNQAAKKRSKEKQWVFDHNATLLNLPKLPAENNKLDNQSPADKPNTKTDSLGDSQDNRNSSTPRRPTVMELMRTHFHTNKSVLSPTPSEVPPPKETASDKERKVSGEYDNVVPQNKSSTSVQQNPKTDKDSAGAGNSFHAIRAFFDGNPSLSDHNSLPAKPKKTVADIHTISKDVSRRNYNHKFTHTDGALQMSTIPKFQNNMRLPQAHGKLQAQRGLSDKRADNPRTAKVSFANSFKRS